jgi:hypothetical protein
MIFTISSAANPYFFIASPSGDGHGVTVPPCLSCHADLSTVKRLPGENFPRKKDFSEKLSPHPGIDEKSADAGFPKADANPHKPDEVLRWWHLVPCYFDAQTACFNAQSGYSGVLAMEFTKVTEMYRNET